MTKYVMANNDIGGANMAQPFRELSHAAFLAQQS